MLPVWEDSFSIHNDTIDNQHKKLFQLAHKAYMMDIKGTNRTEIKNILAEFFDYMKEHFADEESYMQKVGYPDLERHKILHKTIIEELSKTILTIKNVYDMREHLKVVAHDWLLGHILHEDMRIKEFRAKPFVKLQPLKGIDDTPSESDSARDDESEGELEEVAPDERFSYMCGCEGKIHKISPEIHAKIQNKEKFFKCSKCKEFIRPVES